MSDEKTILVKRKDGSFVKMKLSDLKKAPIEKKAEKVEKPTVFVKDKLENTENRWEKEDVASLLEDEELRGLKHSSFNKREKEAMEIIEKLSFKIPSQAVNNLKNSIILFLKDIKDEEQIGEILRQPVYLGGVDLNDLQITELVRVVKEKKTSMNTEDYSSVKSLKRVMSNKNTLPAKEGEILPATSSPFNAFMHKPAFTKEVKEIKTLDELVEKDISSKNKITDLLTGSRPTKSAGEDIVAPKNTVFGPVEEIKNFTVEDLRHLSSNTQQAVSRLKQKFINLKEESFLLYLQALEAWQQSPLYKNYLEQICEGFNNGVSLSALVRKQNSLNLDEIKEIIKMEKEI